MQMNLSFLWPAQGLRVSLCILAMLVTSFGVHAAPPTDPLMQLRVNQLGFYPTAHKTVTWLTDVSLRDLDPAGQYIYAFELIGIGADGQNYYAAGSLGGTAEGFEGIVHPLPPLHFGPSSYVKPGDELKQFGNPTDQIMYQWDFSSFQTPGRYAIRLAKYLPDRTFVEIVAYTNVWFDISADNLSAQYRQMARDAFSYFYQHRMGEEITAAGLQNLGVDTRYARPALHGAPVPCVNDWCGAGVTVGGGTAWADAGDFGIYPVNHAWTVWQMLNGLEFFNEVDDFNILRGDVITTPGDEIIHPVFQKNVLVLEEVLRGSEFMKTLLPPAPHLAPHKIHNNGWGSWAFDGWSVTGEQGLTEGRMAAAPSTAATLAVCRTGAHIARLLYNYGYQTLAREWHAVADEAYARVIQNPVQLYYRPGIESLLFDGGGPYNDGNIDDDNYACLAERYLTVFAARKAGEPIDDATLEATRTAVLTHPLFGQFPESMDWATLASAANLSLLSADSDLNHSNGRTDIVAGLVARVESKVELMEPYVDATGLLTMNPRLPTTQSLNPIWYWATNHTLVNDAMLFTAAARFDSALIVRDKLPQPQRFAKAALRALDYLLGENAINISFITGYGLYAEEDTHDRHAWQVHTSEEPRVPYPRGWLAGGPQNDWTSCVVKEKDFTQPYEKATPFWYANNEQGFLSTDAAYMVEDGFGFHDGAGNTGGDASDQDTYLPYLNVAVPLLQKLFSNGAIDSVTAVPFDPQGRPLMLRAPANTYAAIGTAGDAWCSKENTINWQSGMVWLATAASRYLPTVIGSAPTPDMTGGNVIVNVHKRPDTWYRGGYCADLEIINPNNFSVIWEGVFPVEGEIFEFWNASWSQEGGIVRARASDDAHWGWSIPAGGTITVESGEFGFCADFRTHEFTPTPPESDSWYELTVVNQWSGGYCADVTIYNNSASAWFWSGEIEVRGRVTDYWNMNLTQADNRITISGVDWNDRLNIGDRTENIGFCASTL